MNIGTVTVRAGFTEWGESLSHTNKLRIDFKENKVE